MLFLCRDFFAFVEYWLICLYLLDNANLKKYTPNILTDCAYAAKCCAATAMARTAASTATPREPCAIPPRRTSDLPRTIVQHLNLCSFCVRL